ncbi:MAG: hypothetical protein NVS9B15_07530 [Acidobacteriaceae bacterium]
MTSFPVTTGDGVASLLVGTRNVGGPAAVACAMHADGEKHSASITTPAELKGAALQQIMRRLINRQIDTLTVAGYPKQCKADCRRPAMSRHWEASVTQIDLSRYTKKL